MEDFFKFLMIAGALLIGIYKEARKEKATKRTASKRPAPSMRPISRWDEANRPIAPSPVFAPSPFSPAPIEQWEQQQSPQPKKKKKQKKNKTGKKEEETTFCDLTEEKEDYAIRSVEDARRAILWGEILQRKY